MGRPTKRKGKGKKAKSSPFSVKSGSNRKKRRRKKVVSKESEAMIVNDMLANVRQRVVKDEGREEATTSEKVPDKARQQSSQTIDEALNEAVTQLATVHVL